MEGATKLFIKGALYKMGFSANGGLIWDRPAAVEREIRFLRQR